MTPQEYRSAIDELKLSAQDAAHLFGCAVRVARRLYAGTGRNHVQPHVVAWLHDAVQAKRANLPQPPAPVRSDP